MDSAYIMIYRSMPWPIGRDVRNTPFLKFSSQQPSSSSSEFTRAMALPRGTYYTPKTTRMRHEEVIMIGMDQTAITNATSEVPIIGTRSLNPCYAIILFNRTTRTAIMRHQPSPPPETFNTLMTLVRKDPRDRVEVHLIGGTPSDDPDLNERAKDNTDRLNTLYNLVTAIDNTNNTVLKTCDCYDKPKPIAVAIDSRNGRLIRGSDFFITPEEGDKTFDCFQDYGYISDTVEVFDGTIPEY